MFHSYTFGFLTFTGGVEIEHWPFHDGGRYHIETNDGFEEFRRVLNDSFEEFDGFEEFHVSKYLFCVSNNNTTTMPTRDAESCQNSMMVLLCDYIVFL